MIIMWMMMMMMMMMMMRMRTHCWVNKYIYILLDTLKYSSRDACAQFFSPQINHHIPPFFPDSCPIHLCPYHCGDISQPSLITVTEVQGYSQDFASKYPAW